MSRRVQQTVAGVGLAALLILAAGCGNMMEADADMNRELDRVFAQESLVDRELANHAAAVGAATEPSAVDSAELAHSEALRLPFAAIDRSLTVMSTFCRHQDGQELGRTHDMQAAMTSMRAELDRHRVAPRGDLAAARTEEDKHLGESRAVLTRLVEAATAMRHEAGFYRCAHGND